MSCLPSPDTATKKSPRSRCGNCGVGSVIPRWQNLTKTRPPGDTGGTHYTEAPLPRTHPAVWLVKADFNGIVAQTINDAIDDIGPCAAVETPPTPVVHNTTDKNCYYKNGDTVPMKESKLAGGQWILGRKYWHGCFGWLSKDDGCADATEAADNTKYLAARFKVDTFTDTRYRVVDGPGGKETQVKGAYGANCDVTSTVDATSGIITQTGDVNESWASECESSGVFTPLEVCSLVNGAGDFNTCSAGTFPTINGQVYATGSSYPAFADGGLLLDDYFFPVHCGANLPTVAGIVAAWNAFRVGLGFAEATPPADTTAGWTFSDSFYHEDTTVSPSSFIDCSIVVTVTKSNTEYTWDIAWSVTPRDISNISPAHDFWWKDFAFVGSFTLSTTYTSEACAAHFQAALAAWDMSDVNLAKFRTDETLALAPLCCYDEIGPKSPLDAPAYYRTMDDFSEPKDMDKGIWPQRDWLDTDSYFWRNSAGGVNTVMNETGGNILVTGLYSGAIIAHTQAGSDSHFWFGYQKLKREFGTFHYVWLPDEHGGYADPLLPPVAQRWMTNEEAQYDSGLEVPHLGNFPQAFANEINGVIRGGKFVMASLLLPSVNYGRPCGADKYSVDQTSVCYVSDDASFDDDTGGDLTVLPTTGATAFNTGFALVEGKGIYPVTGLVGTTLTLGARIDTLPTGVNCFPPELWATDTYRGVGGYYVGKLRWPGTSGICGRAAVTAAWSGGILTITTTDDLPYHRKSTAGTILVDLYDSAMTYGTRLPGVSLTRVSNTEWTATIAEPSIAIAYMTGAGVDYSKYSNTRRKTGVLAGWTFSQREMTLHTEDQPAWYGGDGETPGSGLAGVLSGSLTRFYYTTGACPAAIGIVPDGSTAPVEDFPNQILFDFPTCSFDDVFGGHAQKAVVLTMVDPFWQTPFKPDRGGADSFTWLSDDGSGYTDSAPTYYYPMAPLVEAETTVPTGFSLPAGIYLPLDPAHNVLAPPSWPNGIPIADGDGNYGTVNTEWGTAARICGNTGRFSELYATYGITC